jgi:CRP/FNR family cyclic AMP-dependent transcriptional regulator
VATITTNIFRRDANAYPVEAGHIIFETGSEGDLMYAVVDGEVDIVAKGAVLETIGPGGLFGELALVDASNRSATAVARTAATIVPIDKKRFEWLVSEHPTFALVVMSAMAARLRRATTD